MPRWCADGAAVDHHHGSVNRFALALPSMEINTIGAGGGSIAWIDAAACCAWARKAPAPTRARPATATAATQPTCSDANLVLGYLVAGLLRRRTDHAGPAGARSTRSPTHVARPLAMDPVARRLRHVPRDEREHGLGDPRDLGPEGLRPARIPADLRRRRGRRPRRHDRARAGHTPHRGAARGIDLLCLGDAAHRPQARFRAQLRDDRSMRGERRSRPSRRTARRDDAKRRHGVLASEGIAAPQRRFVAHGGPALPRPVSRGDGRSDRSAPAARRRVGTPSAKPSTSATTGCTATRCGEDDAVVELVSIRISALGGTDKPPLIARSRCPDAERRTPAQGRAPRLPARRGRLRADPGLSTATGCGMATGSKARP